MSARNTRNPRSATAPAAALALLAALAAAPAAAAPVRYVVEPNHTFVNFEVRHFDTSTVRALIVAVEGLVAQAVP